MRGLFAVLVAIGVLLLVWPPARGHAAAALLLPDLFSLDARPLVLVSGAPLRSEVRLEGADADLYLPTGGGRHGALVLTLGVHPLDKREAVVVRLADGLSRTGLAVLVVQSEALMADRILPEEPGTLVAAFERLRAEPGVAPERVGLAGFSAGASLAFLAATDPRIAEDVRLVSWLGGYADAPRLVGEILGRSYEDDGRVSWEPHPLSRYVFRKQLVDALADPADRARMEAAYVSDFGRGGDEARAALGELSPEARKLAELFDGNAAAEVPGEIRRRLEQLSPLRAVEGFRSRAFVMVDTADPLVPYAHSRELARALPPERLARYAEFEVFEHVQPTKPLPPLTLAREAWKLYRVVAEILVALDPAA